MGRTLSKEHQGLSAVPKASNTSPQCCPNNPRVGQAKERKGTFHSVCELKCPCFLPRSWSLLSPDRHGVKPGHRRHIFRMDECFLKLGSAHKPHPYGAGVCLAPLSGGALPTGYWDIISEQKVGEETAYTRPGHLKGSS